MPTEPAARGARQGAIGPYEIIKRIGAGGMGAVYKAVHKDLGREVALKVLPADLAGKTEMIERFKLEAKSAAKLRHEHIVTLYEFGESAGTHYLAMEYVEGCNLHEYIERKGKLSPDEARALAIQAARALELAHRQNLVHRDIKPSNFLLTVRDGKPFVKLTDFGLARSVTDDDFKMTRTGTTVGTVDYISPEQARNSRLADIRSDIYSLGCTLYHMLTGRPPFPEGDLTERLLKHVEAEPPDVRQLNPDVPDGLVEVLKKMLAKKPADRYQTPADLLRDLEHLPSGRSLNAREALEILASAEKPRTPPKPPSRSPMAETKKHAVKDPTKPMVVPPTPAPTGELRKLRYRKSKDKKARQRQSPDDPDFKPPIVLEGWPAKLIALGVVAVVGLIAAAISLGWGMKQPTVKKVAAEDPSRQSTEPTKGKTEKGKTEKGKTATRSGSERADAGTSTSETRGDIANETRKRFENLKEELKKRREGSDGAEDRRALEDLAKDTNLPQIQHPGEDLMNQLQEQFKSARKDAKNNLNFIGRVYRGEEPGLQGPDGMQGQGTGGSAAGVPPGAFPPVFIPNVMPGGQGQQPGTASTNPPPFDSVPPPATQPGPPAGQSKGNQPERGPATSTPPADPPPGTAPAAPSTQGAPPQQAPRTSAPPSAGAPAVTQPSLTTTQRNPEPQPQRGTPPAPAAPSTPAAAGTTRPAAPAEAPAHIVRRTGGRGVYASVAAACAAALTTDKSGTVTIEIHDNGPFFEPPVVVTGRDLILRAGKGYRPLLAWNVQDAAGARAGYFLSVSRGNLALENIDLVAKASDDMPVQGLVRVESGDLLAYRCTFSATGRQRSPLAAVTLEGDHADGSRPQAQLTRCYVRGPDLTALDLRARGAEVVVEDCLLVGGARPLVDVVGRNSPTPTDLKVARSTLVAGQTLLRVRPATDGDKHAAVHWLGWDTLLARAGSGAGGEMVDLQDGVVAGGVQWRGVNCAYAGWQTLARHADGMVPAADLDGWRALWKGDGGEQVVAATWPVVTPADVADAPAAAFRTVGTHAGFRSSTGRGALGCDVAVLPLSREGWPLLTYDRLAWPAFDPPTADRAPAIPAPGDGRYHGGKLDLAQTDLGEFLREMQAKHQLGPRVVLHLSGRGDVRTSPVRVKGTTLVLYFDKSVFTDEACRLVPKLAGDPDALIDVEDGGCEILGGTLSLGSGPAPGYLVKVSGGDMRLVGCRLDAGAEPAPPGLRGLVRFDGTGEVGADQARECVVVDSALLSGRSCLQVNGSGVRVRVQNSLLVSGQDALDLQPGPRPPVRRNATCVLERNTAAVRRSLVRVGDAPALTTAVEPFVILGRANVVIQPFDSTRPAGLFALDDGALAHGLVAWQGDANAYDKRLAAFVSAGDADDPVSADGSSVWGPAGDRRAVVFEATPGRGFSVHKPQLERLALPLAVRSRLRGMIPGADLDPFAPPKKR